MSLRAKRSNLVVFLTGIFLSISFEIFACPSGQTCPAGKDCVADSSLCVASSSSSSTTSGATSSEPTTVKDQLGLTLDPTAAVADPGFLSYDGARPDLILLESQAFGLDLDVNYWAAKSGGGGSLSVGSGQNSLNLSLPIAYSQLLDAQNASVPQPFEK